MNPCNGRSRSRHLSRHQLALALAAHLALILAWAGFATHRLDGWVFGLLGLCCFIRSFTAMHALSHCRLTNTSRLRWVADWILAPVTSPLSLGWRELARTHLDHHKYVGGDRDPDGYLNQGPAWRAAFGAFTQPEQGLVRYVLVCKLYAGALVRVAWNTGFLATLAIVGDARGVLAWIAVTRVGSLVAWFVFDWVLHHPQNWDRVAGLSVSAPVRAAWAVAFGVENVSATCFHRAHHLWPWVPDADLPAFVRARVEDGSAAAEISGRCARPYG